MSSDLDGEIWVLLWTLIWLMLGAFGCWGLGRGRKEEREAGLVIFGVWIHRVERGTVAAAVYFLLKKLGGHCVIKQEHFGVGKEREKQSGVPIEKRAVPILAPDEIKISAVPSFINQMFFPFYKKRNLNFSGKL